jgi:hypothetical protein
MTPRHIDSPFQRAGKSMLIEHITNTPSNRHHAKRFKS